jgi:hypothetical protein
MRDERGLARVGLRRAETRARLRERPRGNRSRCRVLAREISSPVAIGAGGGRTFRVVEETRRSPRASTVSRRTSSRATTHAPREVRGATRPRLRERARRTPSAFSPPRVARVSAPARLRLRRASSSRRFDFSLGRETQGGGADDTSFLILPRSRRASSSRASQTRFSPTHLNPQHAHPQETWSSVTLGTRA